MGAMLHIDQNSAEWAAIKDWAERELHSAVAGLKSPRLGHEETQVLRGRVLTLEELIDLPEAAKRATAQTVQPGYV